MSQSSLSGLSDVDAKHKMEWDTWFAENFDGNGNLINKSTVSNPVACKNKEIKESNFTFVDREVSNISGDVSPTSDNQKRHESRDATF